MVHFLRGVQPRSVLQIVGVRGSFIVRDQTTAGIVNQGESGTDVIQKSLMNEA